MEMLGSQTVLYLGSVPDPTESRYEDLEQEAFGCKSYGCLHRYNLLMTIVLLGSKYRSTDDE